MSARSTVMLRIIAVFLICYILIFSCQRHSGILKYKREGYFKEASPTNVLTQYTALLEKRKVPKEVSFQEKSFTEGKNIEDKLLPIIYVLTPTYKRLNQVPELTKLSNTLKHVKSLHWIVVEDGNKTLPEVNILLLKSGIKFTYLYAKPYTNVSKRLKGIHQRNKAIFWLRKNVDLLEDGVVYFADDDNTYDLELFEEVVEFNSWNTRYRKFPVDMAGFALNTKLFYYNPHLYFHKSFYVGYQETQFLELCCSLEDLEPKAAGCTKVLVWHTKASDPLIEYPSYNDAESMPRKTEKTRPEGMSELSNKQRSENKRIMKNVKPKQ